jgi:dTDP-4-dehydrorhamnose 3,5-epimerase-like enzyme
LEPESTNVNLLLKKADKINMPAKLFDPSKIHSAFKIIPLQIHGDEQGSLISLESFKNIPFEIKRVYYIFGTAPGVIRGKHAHQNLKQVLISIHGNCKVKVDNGIKEKEYLLNNPSAGLYIQGLVWREMYDFSPDCVLLVLTDGYYKEEDYIRNYEQFKKWGENSHDL